MVLIRDQFGNSWSVAPNGTMDIIGGKCREYTLTTDCGSVCICENVDCSPCESCTENTYPVPADCSECWSYGTPGTIIAKRSWLLSIDGATAGDDTWCDYEDCRKNVASDPSFFNRSFAFEPCGDPIFESECEYLNCIWTSVDGSQYALMVYNCIQIIPARTEVLPGVYEDGYGVEVIISSHVFLYGPLAPGYNTATLCDAVLADAGLFCGVNANTISFKRVRRVFYIDTVTYSMPRYDMGAGACDPECEQYIDKIACVPAGSSMSLSGEGEYTNTEQCQSAIELQTVTMQVDAV